MKTCPSLGVYCSLFAPCCPFELLTCVMDGNSSSSFRLVRSGVEDQSRAVSCDKLFASPVALPLAQEGAWIGVVTVWPAS